MAKIGSTSIPPTSQLPRTPAAMDEKGGVVAGALRALDSFEKAVTAKPRALLHGIENALAPAPRGEPASPPDPNDPFAVDAFMPKGPYSGMRIDTSVGRSVHILSPEEAAPYAPQPGEMLVANVYHDGKFWIARVPADSVQDVIYQREHCGKLGPIDGDHAQVRFVMKPGKEVTLVPQTRGDTSDPIQESDFVFTCEGSGVPGTDWDLGHAALDHFVICYRLLPTSDKRQAMTENGKLHPVDQWSLNLSDSDKQRVFASAMQEGTNAGLGNMYNTLTRNCTTEAVAALDAVIRPNALQLAAETVTGRALPNDLPLYLRERGVIGEASALPQFE